MNFFTSNFEGTPLGIGAKLAIGSLLLTLNIVTLVLGDEQFDGLRIE